MAINEEAYKELKKLTDTANVTLVAVSKTKPAEDIMELYDLGHRDFGENYVQELVEKAEKLPKDIRWHFIGHLQSNKTKYIAPFVHLVHGVDSEKLLKEINKQAAKAERKIKCLLQVHIAREETKFGLDEEEVKAIDPSDFPSVEIIGFMGMASNTENQQIVMQEFTLLHQLYKDYQENHPQAVTLSMGMSGDYKMAIDAGSNMVRIGSLLFGKRS